MNKISIVLITKNAAKTLQLSLESLRAFDNVVVYDNGSTDATLDIAKSFDNVAVHIGTFEGFGKTKQAAVNCAEHAWVFSLDSDEVITPALAHELQNMLLDENVIYEVRRDNYYNGRHIKCCGWYPERIVRLFNKNSTNFNDAMVHEKIDEKELALKRLEHPINHYSFHSVGDFLGKIQSYSEIYANEHKGSKDASVAKACFRGFFSFFKSYFLRGGFKCGFEGFVISFFNGIGTAVKYLKLHEKNRH